jgi:hypothetical protein
MLRGAVEYEMVSRDSVQYSDQISKQDIGGNSFLRNAGKYQTALNAIPEELNRKSDSSGKIKLSPS